MACHLRRNAFESIKTRYVPNYIRVQTAPTDVLKNLSGLSLCFLRIKYCLSVGAFFERPRANRRACSDVRPYRVLDNFSAKFARPSELGSFLSLMTLREGALAFVSDHRAALSRLTTRAAAEAMRAIRKALSLLLRIRSRTTEPMLTRAAITPTAI